MNPKSQIWQNFWEIRDKGCEENSDLTCPSGLLSHLTKSRPKFPFFSSFEVNRFSGAVRGQSVHRVIGTGPYTGHVGRGADEELDISPERKKQKNVCSVCGRNRWIAREEEEQEDGERNRGSYMGPKLYLRFASLYFVVRIFANFICKVGKIIKIPRRTVQ